MTAPNVSFQQAEAASDEVPEDTSGQHDEDEERDNSSTVIAAVRNDFKQERAKRRAAEAQLRDFKVKASAYDALENASKSEAERAQEAITAAERKVADAHQRVARAEVKAALAGVVDNPDLIVDDLNMARFVDDDGEVDADAVKALRDKYAGFTGRRPPAPDRSQASGANGKTTADPAQEFAAILQGRTH